MKRIMVIGCCGSGKSTFSRELHKVLGLNLIHLDQYYWQPNWTETKKSIWEKTVTELANKPEWIIDGNYGGTMDTRLNRADTIIYLDMPAYKCLWRITKRILKYHGKVRPDMPAGCKERFDLEFYHYVLTYNMLRRKSILKKLTSLKSDKRIEVFRNDGETRKYIKELEDIYAAS
jgi:adenylate kinase family enzyme